MNNIGWICPRCGKVNAPYVRECDCSSTGVYPQPYEPYPAWSWYPTDPPYYPSPYYVYGASSGTGNLLIES